MQEREIQNGMQMGEEINGEKIKNLIQMEKELRIENIERMI